MKQGNNDFVAESTPILNTNNQGTQKPVKTVVNPVHWESDSTEVYTDYEDEDAAACLIAENGDRYAVTRFPFVVGRGDECDLVLHGKGVSRRHAEIVLQSGHFVVNDLNSLNGIKVNGYKVARVILEENDVLKFGEVSLTFEPGTTEGAAFVADEYSADGIAALYRPLPAEDKTQFTSPAKKVYATILSTVLLLGFGAASYLYLNQQTDFWQLKPAAQEDPTANTPVVADRNSGPDPVAAPVVSMDDAPPPQFNKQGSGDAPEPAPAPPSISTLPAPVEAKVEKAEAEVASLPEAPAVKKAPEAQEPAPVKPEPINLNGDAGAAVARSETLYLKGYGSDAISEISPYLGNSAVTGATAKRVSDKYNTIEQLLNEYKKAETAFDRGDSQRGISLAESFIKLENSAFDGKSSEYRNNLYPMMSTGYLAMGNDASQQNEPRKAYNYWQEAVKINDNPQAKLAIEAADSRAQSLYRQALRLEYVNPEKAITMWEEVRASLPPGNEYYTKSNAKIAWYQKWGT